MAGVLIPIISEFNSKGVDAAQKSLKSLAKTQLAGALAGGTLLNVARESIIAANDDAKSQRLLALAITNSTGATAEQAAITDSLIQKMQYTVGVADDELRPAMASLVRVTKDVTAAQDLLSVALDLSAARGVSVETAALALSRAYNGNFKGLKSLGFAITDTTIKNKDFAAAMTEILPLINGAAETAAAGADGGWKRLGLAIGDLSENVGNNLNNALTPAIEKLTLLAQATNNAEAESGLFASTIQRAVEYTAKLIPPLDMALRLIKDTGTESKKTAEAVGGSNGLFRMFEQTGMRQWADIVAKRQKTAGEESSKLKNKLADLAKTTRTELANAIELADTKLKSLQDQSTSFAESIRDQVSGYLSLSDAVQTANDGEAAYNDALKNRADAYAKLNALQAERQRRGFDLNDAITYDAQEYADALKEVASAEAGVSEAQAKRTDYTKAFRNQLEAAKGFANDLKALASGNPPLGSAGIQQLLNLGPIAGAQVAKDLLSGLGGLTVSGLNADLAGLANAGMALGEVTAGGVFGTAIAGAQADVNALKNAKVAQNTTNVTINVSGADPQAVVDALRKYMKQNGSVPIKVTNKL